MCRNGGERGLLSSVVRMILEYRRVRSRQIEAIMDGGGVLRELSVGG